jgi:hypothetical protein
MKYGGDPVRRHSLIHFGSLALCLVFAILASDAAQQAVLSASDPVAADTRTCGIISAGAPAGFNDFRRFPASADWNTGISKAPVFAASNPIVSFSGRGTSLHPDFGAGKWEGTNPGIPSLVDSDRHQLVVDKSNCWLYELWNAYPQHDGGRQIGPPRADNLAIAPAL